MIYPMSVETERIAPTDLRVGYQKAPLDVSPEQGPRFSWSISDPTWGANQSAYRIRLDSSRERLENGTQMWDTGRVESTRSVDVAYDGPSLVADETYYWTVRVWNDAGGRSRESAPAEFTTAAAGSWAGEWIGRQPGRGDSNGYRSRWRDPGDEPTEWVQVDLGAQRTIGGIELHPAEPFTGTTTPDGRTITANDTETDYSAATVADGPVAFGFPDRYRIEVADDPSFDDATTIVDATGSDVADPRRDPVVHDCDATSVRYVRVTATALDEFAPEDDRFRESFDAWAVFALAAVAVRPGSDADDLARDRPVAASSTFARTAAGWNSTSSPARTRSGSNREGRSAQREPGSTVRTAGTGPLFALADAGGSHG